MLLYNTRPPALSQHADDPFDHAFTAVMLRSEFTSDILTIDAAGIT